MHTLITQLTCVCYQLCSSADEKYKIGVPYEVLIWIVLCLAIFCNKMYTISFHMLLHALSGCVDEVPNFEFIVCCCYSEIFRGT